MNLLPLAATNMDAVIGVIAVIAWIVVQALSRKTGKPNQSPRPAVPPAGDSTNPQDELRKFFEDLEKGLSGKVEETGPKETVPPPLPIPGPSATMRPTSPRSFTQREQTAPAVPKVSVPVQSPPPQRSEPVAQGVLRRAPAPQAQRPSQIPRSRAAQAECPAVPAQYRQFVEQIRNPIALRQMVIASEVLARPVGFRDRLVSPFA